MPHFLLSSVIEDVEADDVPVVIVGEARRTPAIEVLAVRVLAVGRLLEANACLLKLVLNRGEEKVVDSSCSSFATDDKDCQHIKYFLICLIMGFLIVDFLQDKCFGCNFQALFDAKNRNFFVSTNFFRRIILNGFSKEIL